MRIHRLARTVLLTFLFAFTSGCSGGGPKTFQVATLTWVGYGPLYLAKEKGFFRGIDVTLQKLEDTSARRAALVSGDVQGSVDIVDSFANAFAAGVPARVVLKLDDSAGGDGIVAKKEIATIRDLKGKTVAYPPGQPSHFFLLSELDKVGLSSKDIDSRPMEPDQAGAAFISGNVDAAVTWEPWLSKTAKLAHAHILVTSRETPGLIADVFTVRRDYLDKNPEVVEAFIRGWFEAVAYWQKNPEESNQIMAKALGIKAEEFTQMVKGIRYSNLEDNRAFFSRAADGSSPFIKLMSRANEIWTREKVIKSSKDPSHADGSRIVLGLTP